MGIRPDLGLGVSQGLPPYSGRTEEKRWSEVVGHKKARKKIQREKPEVVTSGYAGIVTDVAGERNERPPPPTLKGEIPLGGRKATEVTEAKRSLAGNVVLELRRDPKTNNIIEGGRAKINRGSRAVAEVRIDDQETTKEEILVTLENAVGEKDPCPMDEKLWKEAQESPD